MGERTFFPVISPSINLCLSVQVLYSIYMYVCCVHACVYSVHVDACMGGVCVCTCVYDTQLCVNVCLHVCFLVWIWEEAQKLMSRCLFQPFLHTFSQTGSPNKPVTFCFSLTDWKLSPELHPAPVLGYRWTRPCLAFSRGPGVLRLGQQVLYPLTHRPSPQSLLFNNGRSQCIYSRGGEPSKSITGFSFSLKVRVTEEAPMCAIK